MALCESCQAWHRWFKQPENIKTLVNNMSVHKTADDFLQAVVSGCKFCKYIRISRFNDLTDQEIVELHDVSPDWTPNFMDIKLGKSLPTVKGPAAENRYIQVQFAMKLAPSDRRKSASFVLSPLAEDFKYQPTYDRADGTEELELLKRQLVNCEAHHTKCRAGLPDHVPTRLLYVGTTQDPQLKLFVRGEESDARVERYATLSHCWGKQLPFKLQRDNIDLLRERIVEATLPRTFQDAVRVTRYLGVGYLWVDALCIVQDDLADWRHEAARMKDVYQNSLFTIAASYATDSSGGLFAPRQGADLELFVDVWHPNSGCRQFILSDEDFFWHFLEKGSLYRRAWVVQEQFVSTRILHFTASQVFWECACETVCPNYPEGLPQVVQPEFKLGCGGRVLSKDEGKVSPSHEMWRRIICYYSDCGLTFPSDKLIAIQGLVARFQQEYNHGQFLDGLWMDDPLGDLVWYRAYGEGGRTRRALTYRAPSWSWASVDGPIGFINFDQGDPSLAEVQDFSAMAPPRDPNGQMSPGWLDLRGRLLELINYGGSWGKSSINVNQWPSMEILEEEMQKCFQNSPLSEKEKEINCRDLLQRYGITDLRCIVNFDTNELFEKYLSPNMMHFAPIWFLPLRYSAKGEIAGLLLEQVSENSYCRIGFGRLDWNNGINSRRMFWFGTEEEQQVVQNLLLNFVCGKMPFQQDVPDLWGEKTVRLV